MKKTSCFNSPYKLFVFFYILFFMRDYKSFAQKIISSGEFSGSVLLDEPMARHTTFKIGGAVPVFFEPENTGSLMVLLAALESEKISCFILGGGSNVVFCDSGFEGAVVSLLKINALKISSVKDDDVVVSAEAGATMSSFVNFCTENGFSGAEKFAGLPGTVGGALFMNARCFDLSICELFVEARYIDLENFTERRKVFSPAEWDYKVSPFQNGKMLVLSASFRLRKNIRSKEEIKTENKKYIEERKSKGHFDFPSAGSVFRNNRGFGAPSGKIIDECGLRGKQIGMAQIAPFHGNFIINLGGATQKDVKALVEFTVKEVKAKTGFCLQPEIIFVDK